MRGQSPEIKEIPCLKNVGLSSDSFKSFVKFQKFEVYNKCSVPPPDNYALASLCTI